MSNLPNGHKGLSGNLAPSTKIKTIFFTCQTYIVTTFEPPTALKCADTTCILCITSIGCGKGLVIHVFKCTFVIGHTMSKSLGSYVESEFKKFAVNLKIFVNHINQLRGFLESHGNQQLPNSVGGVFVHLLKAHPVDGAVETVCTEAVFIIIPCAVLKFGWTSYPSMNQDPRIQIAVGRIATAVVSWSVAQADVQNPIG